jgi:hypothetical protein
LIRGAADAVNDRVYKRYAFSVPLKPAAAKSDGNDAKRPRFKTAPALPLLRETGETRNEDRWNDKQPEG